MKLKKKVFLTLLLASTIPIMAANAHYSHCQEYYGPSGLIRDCQEMYVSQQIVMPPVAPPPPMVRTVYHSYPMYRNYPRVGINMNFGRGHRMGPIYHHGHRGGLGLGFHISI